MKLAVTIDPAFREQELEPLLEQARELIERGEVPDSCVDDLIELICHRLAERIDRYIIVKEQLA